MTGSITQNSKSMDSKDLKVVCSEDGKGLLLVRGPHAVSFDIPHGVEFVLENAFVDCAELREVTIPCSVKEIGDNAFEDCRSIERIGIPASVTFIGRDCFKGCDRLLAIHVDAGNPAYASVDGVLFDKDFSTVLRYPAGKPDTCFDVPEGIVEIGCGAFEGNKSIRSVHVPSTVKLIADDAFCGCRALETVAFEEGLAGIAEFAFMGCCSLKDPAFPSTLRIIGAFAFSGCTRLRSVALPHGLVGLSFRCFDCCRRLREVRFPATVRKIGDSLFDGCLWFRDVYFEVSDPNDVEVVSFFSEEGDMACVALHVPSGSVDLYRGHPLFGRFRRIETI